MNAKSAKIIYWVTTGLLALFIIPGVFFLTQPFAIEGTKHLGMPYWFHMELGIGKFIGGLILVIPFLPMRLKEWAYVALGIDALSATIGLLSVDGFVVKSLSPLIIFVLLLVSYITYHRLNDNK